MGTKQAEYTVTLQNRRSTMLAVFSHIEADDEKDATDFALSLMQYPPAWVVVGVAVQP